MVKNIKVIMIVVLIFSIVLLCISDFLLNKANQIYSQHHKNKFKLEDHVIYSSVIYYEEVSPEWEKIENTYILLICISFLIKDAVPYIVITSLFILSICFILSYIKNKPISIKK